MAEDRWQAAAPVRRPTPSMCGWLSSNTTNTRWDVYARAATSATSHPASTTTNITGGMYARAATSHPASTRTQVVVQRAPRSEKQNGNGTLPFFGNTSHQLRNKRVLLAPTSDGTLLYVPRLSHSKSELLQKSLATEMTENIS